MSARILPLLILALAAGFSAVATSAVRYGPGALVLDRGAVYVVPREGAAFHWVDVWRDPYSLEVEYQVTRRWWLVVQQIDPAVWRVELWPLVLAAAAWAWRGRRRQVGGGFEVVTPGREGAA